ncbi:exodeoxyribonuclease X C-terminal domain-containing protein [Flavobacteriaceae bacterium 14752]|uniref:exodeoxyribonuclease X C-terminal domain-containing protein n=1 Tax=Mesohalobacter salilacus TaxID=2491711 RepID=UPI000F642C21|nr:hypothetical protein EIG84_12320 [Flavobacteriaceae bacterium 14752]
MNVIENIYDNKKVLIDADSLCYTREGDSIDVGISKLEWKLDKIREITNQTGDDFLFYLTEGKTFRNELSETYKAQRKKKHANVREIKAYLKCNYNTKLERGYEADDLIADDYREDPNNTLICSVDKDILYNLTGKHINLYNFQFVVTTAEEAEEHFYKQIIFGDKVDNIEKLVKGLGDKRLNCIKQACRLSFKEIGKYLCLKKGINYTTRYRLLYMGKSEHISLDEKIHEKIDEIDNFIDYENFTYKTNKRKPKKKKKQFVWHFNSPAPGKYRGKTWKEVHEVDENYVNWMLNVTTDKGLIDMLTKLKQAS